MDSSIIDSAALERLEKWGGSELIAQMVRLFVDNSPERITQIRVAFEEDPGELPERGAHSLKSSAANIGAAKVQKVAADIELAASAGDFDRVRDLIPELESVFSEACAALESLTTGNVE